MTHLEEKCSVVLVITALIVLVINYGYLSVEALSFNVGSISLSGAQFHGLAPIAAFGFLIGSGLCHLRHYADDIADKFSAGYRESGGIVELVRTRVAAAAGDTKYGAPYGGLHGSLLRQSQDLGTFLRQNGTLSAPVLITPDNKTHLLAVVSGIRRLLGRGFWLSVYSPIFLALWALLSIPV